MSKTVQDGAIYAIEH